MQNMVGWGLDLQFILLKNIWNWSAQILRIFGDLTFRFFADQTSRVFADLTIRFLADFTSKIFADLCKLQEISQWCPSTYKLCKYSEMNTKANFA